MITHYKHTHHIVIKQMYQNNAHLAVDKNIKTLFYFALPPACRTKSRYDLSHLKQADPTQNGMVSD